MSGNWFGLPLIFMIEERLNSLLKKEKIMRSGRAKSQWKYLAS